ncbi:MAG: hypothetical protein OXC63_13360 [Aestuariivita sp.]|nr:hypothetical protein [Aestuariivita sp.]MCY4345787.1 hypothetical protein [Aestuariivita sp.]
MVNGADRLTKRGGLLANQKNVIQAAYDGFEEIVLGFSKSCANFVNTTMARIADCMQYDRVKYAHHRYLQKSIGKWKVPK